MSTIIKLYYIHCGGDGMPLDAIEAATRHIGTKKIAWVTEDYYNTHGNIFYDPSTATKEQIKKITTPWNEFNDEESPEWFIDFITETGRREHMIFHVGGKVLYSEGVDGYDVMPEFKPIEGIVLDCLFDGEESYDVDEHNNLEHNFRIGGIDGHYSSRGTIELHEDKTITSYVFEN